MAVKAARRVARKASKPKKAKATRRTTRRKARKAMKPKAPKAARKTVRKVKRAKKITKKMQTGSMRQVWNGTKVYTAGGLMKKDLMMTKRQHVVSKKAFANGRKRFSGLKAWMRACKQARNELKITGFVKMNRGAQGVALYKRAKAIYAQ